MDLLMGAHQESNGRATTNCSASATGVTALGLQQHATSLHPLVTTSSTVMTRPSIAEHNWYAVYTSANHEKRVAEQFAVRGIEHFLPQYESVRKWKDRKVKLQMPLFPGYVFVQIELAKRLGILQVPGVARLVGFDGRPTPVPETELLRVREFLAQGFRAEPHRMLKVGRRVRVKGGPLAGMEGIVARRKNRGRLVISFEMIQRAMAVEIPEMELEAV